MSMTLKSPTKMPPVGWQDTDPIASTGERRLLETVGMTAERLRRIESRLERFEQVLFGTCSDAVGYAPGPAPHEPNVQHCAQDAFGTSVRVERLLDDLIQRTEC